jgi:hypothetical protein
VPLAQSIDEIIGVEKGPEYDQAMESMRDFYQAQQVQAEANYRRVSGSMREDADLWVDGVHYDAYGANFGHDVTEVNGQTHFTTRVYLNGDTHEISGADMEHVRTQIRAGIDHHLNYQHDIVGANGEPSRLHVELEFVDDPSQAHTQITVNPGGGRADAANAFVNDDIHTHAHEFLHYGFGKQDEYVDPAAPARANKDAAGVHDDGGLMTNFHGVDESEIGLRPRDLRHIGDVAEQSRDERGEQFLAADQDALLDYRGQYGVQDLNEPSRNEQLSELHYAGDRAAQPAAPEHNDLQDEALQPLTKDTEADAQSAGQIAASQGLSETPPEGYDYVRTGENDVYLRREAGEAENIRAIRVEDGLFVDVETGQTFETAREVEDYNRVLGVVKGDRPDPDTYIPREKIEAHLEGFDEGASYLTIRSNLDEYGYEVLGRPDGQFVSRSEDVDQILAEANGDISKIEEALGLKPGQWAGEEIVRIDIEAPRDLDLRMPDGNEDGANDYWLPGGMLPTGSSEAVVNPIPFGQYKEGGK